MKYLSFMTFDEKEEFFALNISIRNHRMMRRRLLERARKRASRSEMYEG